MQGLLAKLAAQKNPAMGSKGTSRSASIASSIDGDQNEEDQQSNSDESQSQQTANTLKPKVNKTKKIDIIQANREALKEVKPKKPASKIDTGMTNMVKLKLLDATRKAMIDKKKNLVHAYVQTETFKTKLCRDVSIEIQNDLACNVDKSTETEIELLCTKAKDGTLIITSTRAMNTDEMITADVSVQTAMPRSNIAFKRILEEKHKIQYNEDDDEDDDDSDYATQELINIEKRMNSRLKPNVVKTQKSIDIVIEDETSDIIAIETIPTENLKSKEKGSDSEYEDSIHEDSKVDEKQKPKRPKQTPETYNSWHDLNSAQERVELPRSFFNDGPTPWSSYQDLVLGQKFLNSRVSCDRYSNQMKSVAWSDTQLKIVGDLMREANALMEMFDQVSMLLGPDIKLHKVTDINEFVLPPNKFDDHMTESCDKLEASLKRLQDMNAPKNLANLNT